jgi:hypothetical protein
MVSSCSLLDAGQQTHPDQLLLLGANRLIAQSLLQDDPELEAIRQRRMAELMGRQGVSTAQR